MKSNVGLTLTSEDFPCPVIIHRRDGTIVQLNSEARTLFAFEESNETKRVDELITDLHPLHNNRMTVTCRSSSDARFQRIIKRKTIVKNNVEYFIDVFEEFAESAQAEERLRQSEQNLNKAQSIARIGSWEMDGKFNDVYWSDELYRLHGLEPHSVVPSTKLRVSLTHPKDRTRLEKAIDEAARLGKAYSLENRILLPDGNIRWVLSQGEVSVDELSGRRRTFGVMLDITERKQAEAAMLKLNTRLSETLIFGKMGSAELDISSNMLTASKELMALLDVDITEPLTMPMEEFLTTYVVQEYIPMIHTTMASAMFEAESERRVVESEYEAITAKGRRIWISAKGIFTSASGLGIMQDVTQQREIEHRIRKEKDLSETIINTLPGTFFLFDRDMNFLKWNDHFEKSSGYTAEEITTMSPFDFFGDKTLVAEKMRAVFTTGIADAEIELLTKEKENIPHYFKGWKLEYEGKTCIIGIGLDITQRKLAEIESRKSEERFRSLYNNTPVMLYSTDADGKVISVNDYWILKLEYQREEIIGKPAAAFLADASVKELEIVATRLRISTDEVKNVEIQFKTKSGQLLQTLVSATPELNEHGRIVGSIYVITDISEKKKLEKEIERLALIASNTSNLVILGDENGRINWVNNGFQKITEYDSSHVIGKRLENFLFGQQSDSATIRFINDSLKEGKRFKVEILVYSKSRKTIWLDIESMPVPGQKGFMAIGSDISQLKLAITEMLKSESSLETMMSNAPMAVFIKDPHKRYTFYNEAFKKITGKQELLSEVRDRDIFDLKIAKQHEEGDEVVVRTSSPFSYESTIRDRAYYVTKFPLVDFNNTLYGIGGLFLDITERKANELKLKESEARFRSLADAAPVLVWMADTTKLCNYFNKGWLDFTGRPLEMELGNGWAEGVHPEDLERCVKIYETNFDKHEKFIMEYRLRRHDGVYRWIVDHGVPRYLPNGEFVGYIGSCFDIDELITTRNELAQSEDRLRSIIQTEPNCVKVLNGDRQILEMNRSGLAMIEAESLNHVLHRTVDDLIDEPYRAQFRELTERVLEGESGHLEFSITGLKGTRRWLETQAVPLKDQIHDGNLFLSITRDITSQKIAHDQLLASLKEKETLIKEIHHRVKNNLQLISSILYIRMAGMKDTENKVFLEDMRRKIRSIALIHERLLQSGSVNKVEISDYLGKLIYDLKTSNSQKGLKLDFDEYIEEDSIHLDAAIYCGLIVNELITNSIKHAFKNRSHGNIGVHLVKTQQGHRLTVWDDGNSLPEEVVIGQEGSFGMQLLDIFIKQLSGVVNLERTKGTSYTITFKRV